jgi:hypothetical protein
MSCQKSPTLLRGVIRSPPHRPNDEPRRLPTDYAARRCGYVLIVLLVSDYVDVTASPRGRRVRYAIQLLIAALYPVVAKSLVFRTDVKSIVHG